MHPYDCPVCQAQKRPTEEPQKEPEKAPEGRDYSEVQKLGEQVGRRLRGPHG